MYRWTSSIAPKLRRALHDRRGVAGLVFAATATALIGAAGFAVDVGVLLSARQALQANTNAAVLDAVYQWDRTGGTQSDAVERGPGLERSSSRSRRQRYYGDCIRCMRQQDIRPADVRRYCQQRSQAEADRNRSDLFRQGARHQILDHIGYGGGGQGGRPDKSDEHHVRARHHGLHGDDNRRHGLQGSEHWQPHQAPMRDVRRPVDPEATQPDDRQSGTHGVSGHVLHVDALLQHFAEHRALWHDRHRLSDHPQCPRYELCYGHGHAEQLLASRESGRRQQQ